MPHLKCVACRVRLRAPGVPGAVECPECDAPLEPVDRPSEIIGFRAVEPRADSESVSPLVDRLGDMAARRRAREDLEEATESWRWLNDDGSFDPGSVSAALARAAPLPPDPTRGDR
jgi:hypothetical protein